MTNGIEPIASIPDLNEHPSNWYGLTKRELFAAMAMQGFLAGSNGEYHSKFDTETDRIIETGFERAARESVNYADALIEALNKEAK